MSRYYRTISEYQSTLAQDSTADHSSTSLESPPSQVSESHRHQGQSRPSPQNLPQQSSVPNIIMNDNMSDTPFGQQTGHETSDPPQFNDVAGLT